MGGETKGSDRPFAYIKEGCGEVGAVAAVSGKRWQLGNLSARWSFQVQVENWGEDLCDLMRNATVLGRGLPFFLRQQQSDSPIISSSLFSDRIRHRLISQFSRLVPLSIPLVGGTSGFQVFRVTEPIGKYKCGDGDAERDWFYKELTPAMMEAKKLASRRESQESSQCSSRPSLRPRHRWVLIWEPAVLRELVFQSQSTKGLKDLMMFRFATWGRSAFFVLFSPSTDWMTSSLNPPIHCALFSLLLHMLISFKNTLTDTLRIMFDQIAGRAVSSWHRKLIPRRRNRSDTHSHLSNHCKKGLRWFRNVMVMVYSVCLISFYLL